MKDQNNKLTHKNINLYLFQNDHYQQLNNAVIQSSFISQVEKSQYLIVENVILRIEKNKNLLKTAFQKIKTYYSSNFKNYELKQQNLKDSYTTGNSPIKQFFIQSKLNNSQIELNSQVLQSQNIAFVKFIYLLREKIKLIKKDAFDQLKYKLNQSKVTQQKQREQVLKRLYYFPNKKLKQSFRYFYFKIFHKKYLKQTADRLVLYTKIDKVSAFYRILSLIKQPQKKIRCQQKLKLGFYSIFKIFKKNIADAFVNLKLNYAKERFRQQNQSVTQSVTQTQEVFIKCQKVERVFQILESILKKLGSDTIIQKKEDIKISNAILKMVANLRVNQRICMSYWRKNTTKFDICQYQLNNLILRKKEQSQVQQKENFYQEYIFLPIQKYQFERESFFKDNQQQLKQKMLEKTRFQITMRVQKNQSFINDQ